MGVAEHVLIVPARGLVLLVGASGAGKSTFAAAHFRPTEILSSDAFRGMVGDDEADQSASPAAFDILERVLAHRLRRGLLSVVDATNARSQDRRRMLQLAAVARRPAVAIVFDLPESLVQAQNLRRDGRRVESDVIRRQLEHVRRGLADPGRLVAEGLSALHVLASAGAVNRARVVRDPSLRPATVQAPAGGPGAAVGELRARRRGPAPHATPTPPARSRARRDRTA